MTEERLRAVGEPQANATFQYGIRGRHSWIGHSPVDPARQMTYAEFIGVVGRYITEHAPPAADTESWRY